MKKLLTILFLHCIFMQVIARTTCDSYGREWSYDISGGYAINVAACDMSKFSGNVTLPELLDAYVVKSFIPGAFLHCEKMTSVSIPSGVEEISANMFYGCSSLKSVIIPSKVTNIGDEAFRYSGLTSITIPQNVTNIGRLAFCDCILLTTVTINSNSVMSNFYYSQSLKDVFGSQVTHYNIGEGVTSIGHAAFNGCSNMKSVVLPSSLTDIDERAFYGCSGLTDIEIPWKVKEIGDNAFYGCSKLTSIIVNSDIIMSKSYSPDLSFNHIFGNQVEHYYIGSGVTSIGSSAFHGCTKVKDIDIPSNVISIGDGAFYGCSSLTSVIIPNSVTIINDQVFEGCPSLINIDIPLNVETIGDNAFYGCSGLTNVEIPSKIGAIGNNAFYGCSGLTSIVLPPNVKNIGYSAFSNCFHLNSFTVESKIPITITESVFENSNCNYITLYVPRGCADAYKNASVWKGFKVIIELSGISFADSKVRALCMANWDTNGDGGLSEDEAAAVTDLGEVFKGNTKITSFEELQFFKGLTSINNFAFSSCTGLNSISIPNSVTSIGNSAFSGCSSLTTFTISNSVTDIGTSAFSGCTGLNNITIPNSVSCIGDFAFYGCINLTSVTIDRTIPVNISSNVFPNRSNATLYVPLGSKAAYESANYWREFYKIEEYDIDERILFTDAKIKSLCVANWDVNGDGELSMTEVAAVKNLGSIFKDNKEITSFEELKYFTGLEIINETAFQNCDNLTSIIIPISVTNIGENPFEGCSSLISIAIAEGNVVFDSRSNCNAIIESKTDELIVGCKSTVIPNGVSAIGNSAFSGCIGLTSITIPNSVVSIRKKAFYGCSGLTSVSIGNSVSNIGVRAFGKCSCLSSIVLPSSVTSIELGAFENCDNLTIVSVEMKTPPVIEKSTFSNRINATLYVPTGCRAAYKKVEYWKEFNNIIDPNVIYFDDNKVETICVENWDINGDGDLDKNEAGSITSLGKAFRIKSINSFDELKFFTGLTSIDAESFLYSKLTSITIPNSVTTIGEKAFMNCYDLVSVTIPNSVVSIDESAFQYCESLTAIFLPEGVTTIGNSAFSYCEKLASITFPSTITNIEGMAFDGCNNLTSVIIYRKTPININNPYVFSNLSNATLYVPAGSKAAYEAANIWKNFKEIVEMPAPSSGISFSDAKVKALCIANWDTNADGELSEAEAAAVTELGDVFKENNEITTFNELHYFTGLSTIVEESFSGCSILTSITIPNSVISIGGYAFKGCKSLTSIVIPNSVASIDKYAFGGCSGLESVSLPGGVTLKAGAFYYCKLEKLTISDIGAWCSIDKDEWLGGGNLSGGNGYKLYVDGVEVNELVIPSTVTSIGEGAFQFCSSITSVVIPNSVTEIKGWAFQDCANLASVIIPNSVTSIGTQSFLGCSSLTSISLPGSITNIGGGAFEDCPNLTSVTVGMETPPSINYSAFSNRANATLYVPAGCKNAYEVADYWKEFKEIVETGSDYPEIIPGDANDDGETDMADVVSMINYIMGSPSDKFNLLAADLNDDGEVDIFDVMMAIDLALNGKTAARSKARGISGADEMAIVTATADGISLDITDPTRFTAFQFDVKVADGVELLEARLMANTGNHTLRFVKNGQNSYRVIGVSMDNSTFSVNKNGLVELSFSKDGNIEVSNIIFVTPQEIKVYFTTGNPVVTGMGGIKYMSEEIIFDLSGRRVNSNRNHLPKGIYIINNKVVIK